MVRYSCQMRYSPGCAMLTCALPGAMNLDPSSRLATKRQTSSAAGAAPARKIAPARAYQPRPEMRPAAVDSAAGVALEQIEHRVVAAPFRYADRRARIGAPAQQRLGGARVAELYCHHQRRRTSGVRFVRPLAELEKL